METQFRLGLQELQTRLLLLLINACSIAEKVFQQLENLDA